MNNKLILLFTSLALAASSASAFPASSYSSESKLASGHWVKIKTTNEGIYQISYDELRSMGFSEPRNVQVYGYGGVALTALNSEFKSDFPDDVQPVATHHTADGRILFFGQSDAYIRSNSATEFTKLERGIVKDLFTKVRNPYDTASYYFLSDCDGTASVPPVASAAASASDPLLSHLHIDFIEHELINSSNGGTVFHGNRYKASQSVPYTFAIKDFQPSAKETVGTFYYKYGIKSSMSMSPGISLPSSSLEDAFVYGFNSCDGSDDGIISYTVASGFKGFYYPEAPKGVSEEFTFSVDIPAGSPTYCGEDFVMLRYPRANRLDTQDPFLVMNFPASERSAGQVVAFEDVPEGDLQVWSIDGYVPAAFATSFSDGNASIVLNGDNKAAVAFRPSMSFPSPEVVGDVKNQNIHGSATPDMVIVTLADNVPQARQLADLHKQYQNIDVLVVVHDDIYNEFSSGTREANAYRRMAKMFYDRDPAKFKHIMFLGPAFYDNRCVTSPTKIDRLICYEQDDPDLCNSIVTNYAADQFFAMLDDNYTHSNIHMERTQINVGRVSCINPGQAAKYVAKVKERFENPLPADVFNHILLMAGEGDNAKHSRQANDVISSIRYGVSPNVPAVPNTNISFSPMYVEAYSPQNENIHYNAISAALTRGAGMMAYIGHGSPTTVNRWGVSEVNSAKYTYAPYVLFASCDQFSFDHLSNGLVETMLVTEGGGALGGVGATRSVYIEQNPMTTIPVSVAYASSKPGDTFGDVFRRSRDMALDLYESEPSRFPLKNTTFRNILAYALAGDPALPIGVPEFKAEITSVSGDGTVKPFEEAVFTGSVTKDGVKANFNGSVRIDVLDGSHQELTSSTEKGYTPNTVVFDNEILTVAYGDVKNGDFTVKANIPAPSFPTGSYRVVVSATSDAGSAIGLYEGLSIGDFDADAFENAQFEAPVIKSFYAGDPTFLPGDELTASTTLYAVIDPSSSGLNYMTGNVNTRTSLTIDNSSTTNNIEGFLSRVGDGDLMLEMPLKELSDGTHTIELCVANNVGMVARETIEVLTVSPTVSPEITIDESPATDVATINISDTADECRLIVSDALGNTVHSAKNPSFPYKWNLKDSDGNDVPDGLYNASVLVKIGNRYGATPFGHITVLR